MEPICFPSRTEPPGPTTEYVPIVDPYQRGDLFEKRRKLMEAWANYCATTPVERQNNVTALRAW
jgi:hypothetical protein